MTAVLLAVFTFAMAAEVARAGNTCTWTGSWSPFPVNVDDAIVVSSGGNLTWSNTMPATVASWLQTTGYTGTVTVQTCYSGQGTFTNFTVSGDCVISNGVWTHTGNGTIESYRLRATIGGNLIVGSNAVIDAVEKG